MRRVPRHGLDAEILRAFTEATCLKSRRPIGMRESRTGRRRLFAIIGPPHRLLREINRSPSRVKKSVENLAQYLRGRGVRRLFSSCSFSLLFAFSSCSSLHFLRLLQKTIVYYRADERRFWIASKAPLLMSYMKLGAIKIFSKFVCHGVVTFMSRVRNNRYRSWATLNLFSR